jgi:glycosyltransferase involved in cell wall biosynthesis
MQTEPHAEVDRVDVGDEGLTLAGTVDAPPTHAELVARRRADGLEVRAPATVEDDRFEAHVTFESLPWRDADKPELWDLYLGDLRLGRHRDGVANKRHVYVFPLREHGGRRFRPFYNRDNHLFIRTGPHVRAPGEVRSEPAPEARRRVVPPHELAIHRLVTALARAVLRVRPRPPAGDGRPTVTILIANAYGMGGTVRTCLNVAGFLAQRHDVELISLERRRNKPFFPMPAGVKVRIVDDQRPARPATGWRGRTRARLRARLRPRASRLVSPLDLRVNGECSLWTDLMLVRALWNVRGGVVMGTRPALNLAALLLKRPGTAVVGQEHMNLETHTLQRQREIERRYPAMDAITVLTERDRETYAQLFGSAVRLERIANATPLLEAQPASLERPMALAAGRLTKQKGFDLLIPAFAQVVRHHPEWTLRICGDGPQRKRLERLIIDHDLSNNVLMMGAVDRLDLQMAQASLYLLSSRYEGLPMVMIEAMSLGLPVVSFDCPTGPAEVIEDGRSGVLVPPEDVDALARATLALVEDPERRRVLGAGAAARVKDYALESIGARWEALVNELGD